MPDRRYATTSLIPAAEDYQPSRKPIIIEDGSIDEAD
jgi:hypothetical protein